MNISLFNGLRGVKMPKYKKKVTKKNRKGRQFREQTIVTWKNDRLCVKTIIHQMY